MDLLRFYLLFLLQIFIANLGKVIFLTLTIVSFMYSGDFEDRIIERDVIHEAYVNNEFVYLLSDNDGNFLVKDFENKKDIIDGKISYEVVSELNMMLFILGFIFGIITLVMFASNDLDIRESFNDTFWFFVNSKMNKDGTIDYLIFNRFIANSNATLTKYDNIIYKCKSIIDIKTLPKYYDVKKERVKKIKKIIK